MHTDPGLPLRTGKDFLSDACTLAEIVRQPGVTAIKGLCGPVQNYMTNAKCFKIGLKPA